MMDESDESVERVAKAILAARLRPETISVAELLARMDPDAVHLQMDFARMIARAAIAAMKTEQGSMPVFTFGAGDVWTVRDGKDVILRNGVQVWPDPGIPIYSTTEGPKETFQGKRKG